MSDQQSQQQYLSHDNDYGVSNDSKIMSDTEDVAGKIFIGGLSWQTTEATLRYYFEKFGELSDVALMVDKRTGKPRGFGFIKMKDPAAADVVMANEHTIDGRLVDVKRALPRDKAPGPARSEACKIFVGGLSSEVTEKEFGDYFSKYGVVKDAVVMVDRNTGSSRGFGFITFEREETVEKVLSLEHEIKGKYVEIKRAEPREAMRPTGGYDGGMYGGGGGGMGMGGRNGGGGGRGGGGRYGNGMGRTGDNYGAGGAYGSGGAGGYVGGVRNMGGYGRYPAAGGYAGMAYRGGAAYAMPGVPTSYGYPAGAGGMAPAATMGYYSNNMSAANGGYAGYGAAAGASPSAGGNVANASGYGGAAYGGSAGTTGRSGGESYANQSSGGDYNAGVSPSDASKSYDTSALAGYANAAMQARAQPYGGAYGSTPAVAGYGSYGYGGQMVNGGGSGRGGPVTGADMSAPAAGAGGYPAGEAGYGAYRGQGAAQGRADRSYRPY